MPGRSGDSLRRTAEARARRHAEVRPPPVGKPRRTLFVVDRKSDCEHYRGCLEYARKSDWDGFACDECSDYAVKRDIDRASADAIASCLAARRGGE